jgi:Bacterial Ig-like domain
MGWNGHGAWEDDQELEWIFPEEPELRQTAHLLQRVPRQEAPLDPAFRATLRRRLMQEAWDRAAPALPWWRRLLAPQSMAWAGATVGMVLIAFVVYALTFTPAKPDTQVVVSSPLQGSHAVAATKPIELHFSEAMNTSSVEDAVQIQPAITVKSYQWVNGDSTVQIVPENGLAPNTQYQVTLSQKAKTQHGQAVVRKPTVTFVTAPPPTPRATPTPAPTPRPTPPPGITSPRLIAPSGTPSPVWSPSGSVLYVVAPNSGQLQGFAAASGAAQAAVAPDGVTLVTVGPDGAPAYARNGQLVYGQTSVPATQPVALGFQGSRLMAVSGRQVQAVFGAAGISVPVALAEDASAADFSPNGRRLAYLGNSGLHVLDLTAAGGQDTVVGPATGLGAWSKDGTRYAYLTADGVSVTDGSSPGTKLVSLGGAASASWSAANQLLLTTQSALWISNGDGSNLHSLANGTFTHATWSPAGDPSFWFERRGDVWVASVSAPTNAPATTGAADLVNQFMTARQQGDAALASSLLDANGRQAFSGITLTYTNGGLSRWYILLAQSHQVEVRMIRGSGANQSVLDEALTIAHNSIDGVTETPEVLSSGPNVLNVKVTSTSVMVTFDSDLDPSTYEGGVTIDDVTSRMTYQPGNRTVVVTPEVPLTPGTTYKLTVNSSLRDVNHSPAANYQLTFTGAPS